MAIADIINTTLDSIMDFASTHLPRLISLAGTFLLIFITYKIVVSGMKKVMLSRAKTRREKNDAYMVIKFWRYIFLAVAVISAIFISTGSLTAFGVSAGLFSAALGWALQRPITGIAGWMMVMMRKPFRIGDRIIMGNVKGEVVDITLTHVYLSEVGGITDGEESSGRTIMIPNSTLFEQNIVNYTFSSDAVLDQVHISITYESNMKKAIKLATEAARKVVGQEVIENTKTEPYALTYFGTSQINMYIRYKCPTQKLQATGSAIVREIYDAYAKEKDIEFAYPHRVLINKR
ncbi:MAG: mechanosensitive ion channel family protein [Nanoarchaeota archaeon]